MSPAPLVHLAYHWRGASERLVRIGEAGPAILFLAPLFEEANRTRHFLIQTMRGLAAQGYACYLPDLPGTLESQTPLEQLDWDDWTGAIAAVAEAIDTPLRTVSLRAGCLLDHAARPKARWRLAPQDGTTLARELVRIRMAAAREDGQVVTAAELNAELGSQEFAVAGYRLSPALGAALKGAAIDSSEMVRTLRLEGDIQPADAKLAAQPLWRRSEPDDDPLFCQMLVDDISHWAATCAAS